MSSTSTVTIFDIASYVSAGALASSKLIVTCKPFWNRFPKWFAVILPVLVLDLPLIAQFFNGASTHMELFTALITSLALIMPGLAEAKNPTDHNKTP